MIIHYGGACPGGEPAEYLVGLTLPTSATRHHLHTSPIYDLKKLPRGQKTRNPNRKMNSGQLPSRVDTALQISAVRACLSMPNQISKISGEFIELKVMGNYDLDLMYGVEYRASILFPQ